MNFFGAKPYSPEMGELEDYLRSHEGVSVDNLFHGSEYFFILKEKDLLVLKMTLLRVNASPLPDQAYFVNEDFLLESKGPKEDSWNMSCMPAPKGSYDPREALKNKSWSIHGLNLKVLYPEEFSK